MRNDNECIIRIRSLKIFLYGICLSPSGRVYIMAGKRSKNLIFRVPFNKKFMQRIWRIRRQLANFLKKTDRMKT